MRALLNAIMMLIAPSIASMTVPITLAWMPDIKKAGLVGTHLRTRSFIDALVQLLLISAATVVMSSCLEFV